MFYSQRPAFCSKEAQVDFRVRQLQCFLTLADLLNYGKTARALYMSQPAITFQIQSLEDAFGMKLFERDRKQVRLTSAGETLRPYIQSIMDTIDQAQQHLRRLDAPRRVRVSCGTAGLFDLLPMMLRALAKSYPLFELEVVELTTEEQMEHLSERKIDAVIMGPSLPVTGAVYKTLYHLPLCALVSRQNAFAKRAVISIHELHGKHVIATRPEDCRFQRPFLNDLFQPHGVVPVLVEVPQATQVQMAYAAADAGVMITAHSAGVSNLPEVAAVPFLETLPTMELGYMVMADNQSESLEILKQVMLHCAARLNGPEIMPKASRPEQAEIITFPKLRSAV